MKYLLEDLIHPHKLNHGKHDTLIKDVAFNNERSPNITTIAMNAYYKIKNAAHKGGWLESDIDLLQMLFDSNKYQLITDYKEIPFNESTLLLFEMKSSDSHRNHNKAMYQLKRSKNMIKDYTDYQSIDCFYAFNAGKSQVVRFEQVD